MFGCPLEHVNRKRWSVLWVYKVEASYKLMLELDDELVMLYMVICTPCIVYLPNLFIEIKAHICETKKFGFFNNENRNKIQVTGLVTKKCALAISSMRRLALNLKPGP